MSIQPIHWPPLNDEKYQAGKLLMQVINGTYHVC